MVIQILLLVLLFNGAISNDPLNFLNEKQKQNLEKLDFRKLSDNTQRFIRDVTLHGNATAHWCCNIPTSKTIMETHSQLMYVTKMADRVTYTSCGFLWLSSCSRHHYSYYASPLYRTTYNTKTINISCPDEHLVCCKGYVLVAEHCLPLSEIPAIKHDLINLHNAGILG
ncbi:uncharacterized protein LOC111121179 [Crassostrea virginica]|uniref:Uncharacterized protein LOC111121179 n=1 Tax=Crassostrea virginica TaxID=6565 RepID=A0A8B8CQJ7_CRAVI|nr:uncharacterized protein LOC111121179 [Crassostrea virginica]